MNIYNYIFSILISFIIISFIILFLMSMITTNIDTFTIDTMNINSSDTTNLLSNLNDNLIIYLKFNNNDISNQLVTKYGINQFNANMVDSNYRFSNLTANSTNLCNINTNNYVRGNASLEFTGSTGIIQYMQEKYISNNFTVAFYLKNTNNTTGIKTIVAQALQNPTLGWMIRLEDSSLKVIVGINRDNDWRTIITVPNFINSTTNNWYHIALTYEQSANPKWNLYLDGTKFTTSSSDNPNRTLQLLSRRVAVISSCGTNCNRIRNHSFRTEEHFLTIGCQITTVVRSKIDTSTYITDRTYLNISLSGGTRGINYDYGYIGTTHFYIKFLSGTTTLNLPSNVNCTVDILIVGGGGQGGNDSAGGGGGGEVIYYTNDVVNWKSGNSITLNSGNYYITVGNGGVSTYNRTYPILYNNGNIINPIVWYKFDNQNDILLDSSGNNRNLLNYNSGGNIETTNFVKGYSCVSFNTSRNFFYSSDTISNNVPLTFSFWFNAKYNHYIINNYYTMLSYNNNNIDPCIQFDLENVNSTIFNLSIYTALNNHWSTILRKNQLNFNTWYHITFTLSNSNPVVAKLYINGELITTQYGNNNQILRNTGTIYIGYSGDFARGYDGLIDDFRLYNLELSLEHARILYYGRDPSHGGNGEESSIRTNTSFIATAKGGGGGGSAHVSKPFYNTGGGGGGSAGFTANKTGAISTTGGGTGGISNGASGGGGGGGANISGTSKNGGDALGQWPTGAGGAGIDINIIGTSMAVGGGGSGGCYIGGQYIGEVTHGGGKGASGYMAASHATVNTGGGGGGSGYSGYGRGNGGSGIVIIKFLLSDFFDVEQNVYRMEENSSYRLGNFLPNGTLIDDFRLYNATLNENEVKTIYYGTLISTIDNSTISGEIESTDCIPNELAANANLISIPSSTGLCSNISAITMTSLNTPSTSQFRQTFTISGNNIELLFSQPLFSTTNPNPYSPIKLFNKDSASLNDSINYCAFLSTYALNTINNNDNYVYNYNIDGTYALTFFSVPDCGNIRFNDNSRPKGDYIYIKFSDSFILKRYSFKAISGFASRAPANWTLYIKNGQSNVGFPSGTTLSSRNYCQTNQREYIYDMFNNIIESNEYLFVFHNIVGNNANDRYGMLAFQEMILYKNNDSIT